MIYTCQHCGAWLPTDKLKNALSNNESTIICPYCGMINDIGVMKTSHVAKGYDCLEKGDFYNAEMEFSEALRPAQHLDLGAKSAYLEAYLGQALAKYSVQVIYEDEVADKSKFPEVYCHVCNDGKIIDDTDFQIAYDLACNLVDDTARREELNRLDWFSAFVDGVKDSYDKFKRKGEKYNLFVAYEDNADFAKPGYNIANTIKTEMPDKIKKTFLPLKDEYLNDAEYEGAILYAIHNSNCMLVVADDDIDARLMNIYSRFYFAMVTNEDRSTKKELGFVRYKGKIQIHLPDHKISNNIFDYEDKESYHKLVFKANNIVYVGSEGNVIKDTSVDTGLEETINLADFSGNGPLFEGNKCIFGKYPQRLEKDVNILSQFSTLPKPSPSDDKGWTVMFTTKKGTPYTWYLDKEVNGKKYRAVYFQRFREVFTVRESDLKPSVQRVANYGPMRIYVFAYEPIEWNILEISMDQAVLVSSVGLDCKEFNDSELASDWDCSSLKAWLNYDFFEVAFNDEDKRYVFENEDVNVSIIDIQRDFSKALRKMKIKHYNITGTDYFKALGGLSDRNVSNFWVKTTCNEYEDRALALQPHSIDDAVPQCVDSTTVSVVPKVIVRFNP